ncbi:Nn.00g060250.m01.CDS01 [Neocucurbitaria sp. VM-36]
MLLILTEGLSVPCVPKAKGHHLADNDAIVNSGKLKARITRVHTGCFTCKKRRKKCDEVKPKCADCRRLNLPCNWPTGRGCRHSTATSDILKGSISPHALDHDQFNTVDLTKELVPDYNEPLILDWMPEINYNMDIDDFPHDWDFQGCPDPSVMSPIILLDDTNHSSSPSGSELSLTIPASFPDLTSCEDRALLNHFMHIVAPILSRRGTNGENPYMKNLLPLASNNEIVLDSILALSAKHWRKCMPELAARGAIHQSQATRSLAVLLPQVDRTAADLALVSSLVLCMTELFDGVSTSWKFHLSGAKRLLDALKTQKRQGGTTTHHKFLVRLYHFLDSATTTSTCRPPIIEENEDQNEAIVNGAQDSVNSTEVLQTGYDDEDSAVYGIPKPLFHLVDRVNTLAYKRRFRKDEASDTDFRRQAAKVEQLIDNWSYEYGSVPQAVSKLCFGDLDAYHAATAFEWALRLRLHQIVEGYGLDNPVVDDAVNCIVESTQKIRYGSALESCLLFPLVMAGGACSSLEHRLVIQDRLMVMERTCGFGYVYNARELLERVWKRRTQGVPGAVVNWARIRFEEMDGLVIF